MCAGDWEVNFSQGGSKMGQKTIEQIDSWITEELAKAGAEIQTAFTLGSGDDDWLAEWKISFDADITAPLRAEIEKEELRLHWDREHMTISKKELDEFIEAFGARHTRGSC